MSYLSDKLSGLHAITPYTVDLLPKKCFQWVYSIGTVNITANTIEDAVKLLHYALDESPNNEYSLHDLLESSEILAHGLDKIHSVLDTGEQ